MDIQIDNFWSCANPLASVRGFHDLTWKGIGNGNFGKQFLDHPLLAWRFLRFCGSSMFFWIVQVLSARGLHSGLPKFANKTYDFGPFRSLGTPTLPRHPSEPHLGIIHTLARDFLLPPKGGGHFGNFCSDDPCFGLAFPNVLWMIHVFVWITRFLIDAWRPSVGSSLHIKT